MCRVAVATLVIAGLVIARSARVEACEGSHTMIFGVPVWSTDPNEGNTWGAMPILMSICPDKHTQWIFAPSATWNKLIHYTGTLRWFQYPDRDTSITATASVSTVTNYNASAVLQRLPPTIGAWTDEGVVRVERSLFARFYGLGPDSLTSAQSSYTFVRDLVNERRGLNLDHHINVGAVVGFEHDAVDDVGVPGLPLSPEVFPDVPGMHGSTVLSQGLDLRYDDRVGGSYAESGVRVDLRGDVVEGLVDSPTFLRGGAEVDGIWPELSWLAGAARLTTSFVSSSQAPFYLQSQLGGPFLLRGYDQGRFVARDAWTAEVEQRFRVLQIHLFGVVADWQLAPFGAVGQVFDSITQVVSNPKEGVGLGIRVFVHPSIVGRVDLAVGTEGLKAYVEIGYPY